MERERVQVSRNEFQELLLSSTPKFYVTPTLVVLNVAYFAVCVLLGSHPLSLAMEAPWRFGALFGPMVFEGEWWRLLTATFVHAGFLHLFLNMWALWGLGNLVERMFGNVTFLVIYLLSGLGGSIGTLLWHPYIPSVGASGAIFGTAGALLAFLQFGKIRVPEALTSRFRWVLTIAIGLNLALGLALPFIDNAAHVGGLVVGLLLGTALHRSIPDGERSPLGLIAVPAVAIALVLAAQWSQSLAEASPRMKMAEALPLLEEGRYGEATEKVREAILLDPDFWEAHFQLGMMAFEEGDFEVAADELSRAIELDEAAAPYRPMLGFAYSRVDELEKARATLDAALEDSPDSPVVLSEVGIVQHRLGDDADAIASLRRAIELEPDNSEHHNRLALVLAVTGDAEGSLAEVEAALDLEPRGAHIWDSSGTVYFYRKDWTEAIASYRKAIQLDPESAIYHYNLSLALSAAGETDAAEEERARAFELDPELEPPEGGAPLIWS